MSVRIRLAKTGKSHKVSYRLVAQDAHSKRDGRFLEILGHWLPYLNGEASLDIKRQRVDFWISKGAKPTLAVQKLLSGKTDKKLKGQPA